MNRPPRVRAFCGPNGSGKTTLLRRLARGSGLDRPLPLGYIVNADDLLVAWRSDTGIDTSQWPSDWSLESLAAFVGCSPIARLSPIGVPTLKRVANSLLTGGPVDAYHAAALADWLRRELVAKQRDFTFETVMSHENKVAFLNEALSCGYRVYLYWVVTEDAEVNVERVAQRVREGGHDVPPDKIRRRYGDALKLLRPAMEASHRAYLFDNSTALGPELVAEWERPGPHPTLRCSPPGPAWLSFARK